MTALQDLDIPKKYKRNKKIHLYKAFILKDGDSMNVHTDVDILSFDYQSAIQFMISSMDVLQIPELKGKTVNFAVFTFESNDILMTKLVDEGEVYCQDLSISITLKNKIYKVDVEDHLVEDIEVEIDPKTEMKKITSLKLMKIT